MGSTVYPTIGKVTSALKAMGIFKSVEKVEPKGAPESGLSAVVYLDSIHPVAAASGLSSVSGLYIYTIRLYTNMLQEPAEKIDEILAKAIDKIFDALAGDFDLGDTVKKIDIFGEHGTTMKAVAGYVEVNKIIFRSVDITLPLVINDTWALA